MHEESEQGGGIETNHADTKQLLNRAQQLLHKSQQVLFASEQRRRRVEEHIKHCEAYVNKTVTRIGEVFPR